MKINYMSDLHLEFHRPSILEGEDTRPQPEGGDVLVLAGDIQVGSDVSWIADQAEHYGMVYYVGGNHEYYNHKMGKVNNDIRAKLDHLRNVKFLEKESHTYGGVTFHGTTLWADFDNGSLASMAACGAGMNDYRCIVMGDTIFSTEMALRLHRENVQWLKCSVGKGDVVITHHAPSLVSIDMELYGNSSLNGAYASDLDDFILQSNPVLWVHGHMHETKSYELGGTAVRSNPYGYYGYEENPMFDVNKSYVLEG